MFIRLLPSKQDYCELTLTEISVSYIEKEYYIYKKMSVNRKYVVN